MKTNTMPNAAALLSARWTPSTEPGVILAEMGQERGAVGLAAIDPHRALDLSDADASTLAVHVANAHNMAICTTSIVGCTLLPPESMEQLAALAATPGIVHTADEYAGVVERDLLELLKSIFNAPTMAAGYEILADWAWQCGFGEPAALKKPTSKAEELAAETAASLFDGTVLTESRLAKAITAAIRQHSEAEKPPYPETLTPALLDALGTMNFRTGPIAHALRRGGADIPRKCEAEQAHVLHWFIRLALQHGDGWRDAVGDELQRIADAAKAAKSAS